MNSVYLVHHVHVFEDETEDVKLIGVYSNREKAMDAVARLSQQPGFCDCPEGFQINEYKLDRDEWREGYVTVD